MQTITCTVDVDPCRIPGTSRRDPERGASENANSLLPVDDTSLSEIPLTWIVLSAGIVIFSGAITEILASTLWYVAYIAWYASNHGADIDLSSVSVLHARRTLVAIINETSLWYSVFGTTSINAGSNVSLPRTSAERCMSTSMYPI